MWGSVENDLPTLWNRLVVKNVKVTEFVVKLFSLYQRRKFITLSITANH